MYDSEVGHNVRLSFKALARLGAKFSPADSGLLRRRIEAAVDELKGTGWPVERIIIRMKEVAAEAGIALGNYTNDAEGHPVVGRAISWCVQRYYRDTPPTARTPRS